MCVFHFWPSPQAQTYFGEKNICYLYGILFLTTISEQNKILLSIFCITLMFYFKKKQLLSGGDMHELGKPQKKIHPLVTRPLRPYPPPSSLMAIGTFFKIAENGFWHFFFSPHNFWTKIALFFGKFCNIQVKIPTDKL